MGTVNSAADKAKIVGIQNKLKSLGLYTDVSDGLFGNGSLEAFRRVLGGNTPVTNPHSYVAENVFISLQTALKAAGYDPKGIDGIWGTNSQLAFDAVVNAYIKEQSKPTPIPPANGTSGFKFGSLSESRLIGVKPQLVKVVRRALELAPEDFGVREGLRTIEQQRENVKNGASQTMNSKHLTGDAVDLYPTKLPAGWQKNPKVWLPIMTAVKRAGDELGVKLRFGINWKNDPNLSIETKFIDAPHVELA